MTSNPVFSANSGRKVLGFLEWLCLSAGVETTLQLHIPKVAVPEIRTADTNSSCLSACKNVYTIPKNVFCLGANIINVSSPGKIRYYCQTKIFEGGC